MIKTLHYPCAGADTLLIMLPGAGITAEDFAAQGMVAALQARRGVAVIAAAPDIALYLENGVTAALHEQVVAPALARGIKRIWLLGISLGGMGALLYATVHQQYLENIFLIAPFLGTKGTVAELARAGGIAPWRAAQSCATNPEQNLLAWLQVYVAAGAGQPALYLGYATQDRFAAAHAMLAACLPPARVAAVPGGHDWPSWRALWQQMLALLDG